MIYVVYKFYILTCLFNHFCSTIQIHSLLNVKKFVIGQSLDLKSFRKKSTNLEDFKPHDPQKIFKIVSLKQPSEFTYFICFCSSIVQESRVLPGTKCE